jgi:hypothetical protein
MDYLSIKEQGEHPLLAMKWFEAGADAMLGALREQGVKAKTSAEDKLVMAIDQIMMNLGQNEKGKVVFIPDEEADDES